MRVGRVKIPAEGDAGSRAATDDWSQDTAGGPRPKRGGRNVAPQQPHKLQGDDGGDVVHGGAGNDTIWAWDGYADRLDGGPGSDRAWKDKLDHVLSVERFG